MPVATSMAWSSSGGSVHTELKHLQIDGSSAGELRCDCGKLLARVLRSVLELKCPRCKRVVLVMGDRRYQEAGAAPCRCGSGRDLKEL
jgi:phage FluMu protein Com